MINWEEARELGLDAEQLLAHYLVDKPPIPLDRILQGLGVLVVDDPEQDGCFELWVMPKESPRAKHRPVVVAIDPSIIPERRRDLLAQAVGHLLHDRLADGHTGTKYRTEKQALKAIAFADDLLLPLWLLYFYVEARLPLSQIARQFRAPVEHVRERAKQL